MKSIENLARELFLFGFEEHSFEDIIRVLKEADERYFNDDAVLIEDNEYDALKQYANALNPTHPYFLGVGSAVRGGKVKLPFPMGSLTQAYQGDVEKWVAKHKLENELVLGSDKEDGVSALIVYHDFELQIAYSRGDGVEGADITRHVRQIKTVPQKIRVPNLVVRGEIIIAKKNFPKAQAVAKSRSGQQYKNPRNMTAGMMNASNNPAAVYQFIDFVAYEVVQGLELGHKSLVLDHLAMHGFLVPEWKSFKGKELSDDVLTAYLNERRENCKYEIDGIVLEVNKDELRNKINPTKDTLNPEYARKFKVADASNLAITEVIDVEWNVSKDGYLKPRVKIQPVQLVGATVQHASGFNAKFINDNKIGPGAKIKITRSGDVIPFILEVVQPAKKAAMPTVPSHWTSTGVDLIVENAQEHDTVKFEQLNDFFMTLDAPHLREGNIQKIFDAGIERPEEVIQLTQNDLSDILGSSVVAKKIFLGLREKLTNIPMYQLMGAHPAFGRGVGVRKMKKLYEAFKGDTSKMTNVALIEAVEGFDTKTANKVVAGYPTFVKFLEAVKKYVSIAPYTAPKTGSWSNQVVVMTGFRSKELEQALTEQGGKLGTTVSSKTTLVVADDPTSTSGKAQKARELGIRIIGIEQFKKELGV